MKFVCFGYLDVPSWMARSVDEQNALIDACCAYDEFLKKNGHWAGGEGLQGPETATTLRYQHGRLAATDGPYTETKELLGGLLILEANDREQALQLLSNHPGLKMGPWEIRPAEDLSGMIAESEKRRRAQTSDAT